VQLVLVGGGPGSGKTTLAQELAPDIDAVVISTDEVRQQLAHSGQIVGTSGSFEAGRYDPENVKAVYDTVLQRAADLLARGQSVILDGTWRDAEHRRSAHDVADEYGCPTVEVACTGDVDQALGRIRLRGRGSHSEVTPELAERLYRAETPWAAAHHIDTTQPLSDSVAEATAVCCLAI
jgi:uncharacterized protein